MNSVELLPPYAVYYDALRDTLRWHKLGYFQPPSFKLKKAMDFSKDRREQVEQGEVCWSSGKGFTGNIGIDKEPFVQAIHFHSEQKFPASPRARILPLFTPNFDARISARMREFRAVESRYEPPALDPGSANPPEGKTTYDSHRSSCQRPGR